MHPRPGRLELFDDEPPPRRRFQRDLERLAAEAFSEPPDARTVGRRDPRARDLA
jgi:hypothetical protein